jgi:hypothetical protein
MSSYISKPRTPKRRKRPKSGPQYHGAVSAVHPQETPGARLGSSPFAHRDFEGARAAPSYSRCARCRECPGPGPTASSGEFRTVRSRGTRGTRLSHLGVSLIAISRSKDQPLPIRERRKRLWNKHRVTARGHLGKKRAVQKGPKASSFSHRKDHRDLQVPSDPTSILVFAWSK